MRETYRVDTEGFCLQSYGHGIAFCLTNKKAKRDVFMQGDDATTFHDELMLLQQAKPHWSNDDTLRDLWSRYSDASCECV